MKRPIAAAFLSIALMRAVTAAPVVEFGGPPDAASVVLADPAGAAAIAVDPREDPVVTLAAGLFAGDVERVTGRRPKVADRPEGRQVVIVGTLGRGGLVDSLVAAGKLGDADRIRGRWEATLWQIVDRPFPGVDRALVIAGADRRGTAYGLTGLSENIGVSPWCWWADVPVRRRGSLVVRLPSPQSDAPAVKYRGIFINDEDWGLQPWAARTFDPAFGNIGPKTYEKVYELMLRLRLNYLWPAMHACSAEFASQPENARLADRFGIVAGSSHCEPMLCNNVNWDERTRGKWDYTLNRDAIHSYWEESVRSRGGYEAVWTLGIRGIHDRAMEGPADLPTRVGIVSQVIRDQRDLLARGAARDSEAVAQCFVPYKEVLPIYDSGLKVPDDVTLVWVDDNFGYIRRLGSPDERRRSGGAGVYWHISYYGRPHSYTWINTTPPAFMWEELHKAWENDAQRLWVLNVGDIKPMEIGVDFFARLAWSADSFGPDSQPPFLRRFAAGNFGEEAAPAIAALLGEFYRLGEVRKPELMERAWALALPWARAAELEESYRRLLREEEVLAASIRGDARDAYFETIGFPARVLGSAGLIFMADRRVQMGIEAADNAREIARLRAYLEAQVRTFNTGVAGGKWNRVMPGLETGSKPDPRLESGKNMMDWSSQVRWPWGDHTVVHHGDPAGTSAPLWRDAAAADGQSATGPARWTAVPGLGSSGRAMALEPASLDSTWSADDRGAPTLTYAFNARGTGKTASIEFLPTFRICPGMKLRVAVAVDGGAASLLEVPGSGGQEDEGGSVRQAAVQDNAVRIAVPLPALAAGDHTFAIRAVDPGVVINRVSLP